MKLTPDENRDIREWVADVVLQLTSRVERTEQQIAELMPFMKHEQRKK